METMLLVITGKVSLFFSPFLPAPYRGYTKHSHLTDGSQSFFLSPDGTETWNLFHASTAHPKDGLCGPSRYTMAQRVYFNTMGEVPRFEQPQALNEV